MKTKTLAATGLIVTLLASVAAAEDDGVLDMCLDTGKPAELCSCAAEKLKAEQGDDAYALYAGIGSRYLEAKAGGASMGDAWDGAVREEAGKRGKGFTALLTETNALGKEHRKAMRSCSQN